MLNKRDVSRQTPNIFDGGGDGIIFNALTLYGSGRIPSGVIR